MTEIPENKSERKEKLEDNARKFRVGRIDPAFLQEHEKKSPKSSYVLVVDWLKTGNDNETKVARKTFGNGEVEILLISKVTKEDGKRDTEKEPITEEQYKELVGHSLHHLEKRRYELTYTQKNISLSLKYDEFTESEICMLEVDAPSEEERSGFSSSDFPTELTEVTGDMDYYGYRMVETLHTLGQTA